MTTTHFFIVLDVLLGNQREKSAWYASNNHWLEFSPVINGGGKLYLQIYKVYVKLLAH